MCRTYSYTAKILLADTMPYHLATLHFLYQPMHYDCLLHSQCSRQSPWQWHISWPPDLGNGSWMGGTIDFCLFICSIVIDFFLYPFIYPGVWMSSSTHWSITVFGTPLQSCAASRGALQKSCIPWYARLVTEECSQSFVYHRLIFATESKLHCINISSCVHWFVCVCMCK